MGLFFVARAQASVSCAKSLGWKNQNGDEPFVGMRLCSTHRLVNSNKNWPNFATFPDLKVQALPRGVPFFPFLVFLPFGPSFLSCFRLFGTSFLSCSRLFGPSLCPVFAFLVLPLCAVSVVLPLCPVFTFFVLPCVCCSHLLGPFSVSHGLSKQYQ